MYKLKILPSSDSYRVSYDNGVRQVKLDGGSSRFRVTELDNRYTSSLSFVCDRVYYKYLTAFLRTHKTEPFLCDLIVDDSEITEHICNLIPNTQRLTGQKGYTYFVTFSVEFEPIENDEEYDEAIVGVFDVFGDLTVYSDFTNALQTLANENLAET